MGMGGDGGGATTTTKTTQTLPKWLQPYAKQLAGQAASLYGAGAQYPQQQVAPLNQTQQQAFQQFQDLYGNLRNQRRLGRDYSRSHRGHRAARRSPEPARRAARPARWLWPVR